MLKQKRTKTRDIPFPNCIKPSPPIIHKHHISCFPNTQITPANSHKTKQKQRHHYNLRRRQALFQVGDLVWVRTHPLSRPNEGFMAKLAAKWKGPAKVIKCLGPVNYSVSFVDGPDHVDSYVQNLKPFYGHVETLSN